MRLRTKLVIAFFAFYEIGAESGLHDLACDVVSDDERKLLPGRNLELPLSNDHVFRIHADEARTDENLPTGWHGAWDHHRTQHLG